MTSLVGKDCRCVFNLPPHEWPFEGYPAWVRVVSVDMPMVEMTSKYYHQPKWVNASIIQTIEAV